MPWATSTGNILALPSHLYDMCRTHTHTCSIRTSNEYHVQFDRSNFHFCFQFRLLWTSRVRFWFYSSSKNKRMKGAYRNKITSCARAHETIRHNSSAIWSNLKGQKEERRAHNDNWPEFRTYKPTRRMIKKKITRMEIMQWSVVALGAGKW